MHKRMLWLGAALVAGLALVGAVSAEPRGKESAAGGKGGCADKAQVGFGKGGFADKAGDRAAPGKGAAGKGDKAGPGKGEPAAKGGKAGGKGGPAGKGGGKAGPGGRGGDARRAPSTDETIDRILTFDKNKDGKIAKDELPERMQDLVAKGDTNKDGALDKDEIRALATTLAREGGLQGRDGRGGPGAGPRPGPGGPAGPRGPGGAIDRALGNLNLADKKKDQAEAVVKAHQESVRRLMDLARSDLLLKMKEVLSEQEYKTFKEALERQPGAGPAAPPADRPGNAPRKPE